MKNSKSNQHRQQFQRQRGSARIPAVFAILLVAALGALAAPQYGDQNRDYDRGRSGGALSVSRESTARDFGGGNGGRPAPDALCEPESVAVGFHVQTGEFFNEAWLDCARIRRDGRLGRETSMTQRTGSPGGRPVHDAFCPPGSALRGLRGRTGGSIDVATGMCSPLRDIASRNPRPRTQMTQPVARPGAGGHPAGTECPPGFVVTGFRSMSGEYMDHLWIVCSELRVGR
jgi:hypothetical protein